LIFTSIIVQTHTSWLDDLLSWFLLLTILKKCKQPVTFFFFILWRNCHHMIFTTCLQSKFSGYAMFLYNIWFCFSNVFDWWKKRLLFLHQNARKRVDSLIRIRFEMKSVVVSTTSSKLLPRKARNTVAALNKVRSELEQ
jgi:hypothetical protein